MELNVAKELIFQRPDQKVKIIYCADRVFFVYNHRGQYRAVFSDIEGADAIADFIKDPESTEPLFMAELKDYDMYEDNQKQDEMEKDVMNYIESDCRKSLNEGGNYPTP